MSDHCSGSQLIENGGEALGLGFEVLGQLLASEAVVAVPDALVRIELREDGIVLLEHDEDPVAVDTQDVAYVRPVLQRGENAGSRNGAQIRVVRLHEKVPPGVG